MDGAHTHNHGPTGPVLGVAVAVGAALALAASAVHALATIVHVLVLVLGVAVGLAVAGLVAWVVIAYRRYRPPRVAPLARAHIRPDSRLPYPADREVVALRQAVLELQAQLVAARAAQLAQPPLEAGRHLHLHGLNPDQVAAVVAACRRQVGEHR